MGITVSSANGIAVDNSISEYSYSEEANSIEPSALTGGSGAANVTLDGVDFTVDAGIAYIGSNMTLTDGTNNSVVFKVNGVNKTSDGKVALSGDTLTNKMNIEVTAAPFNGTLKSAINYYCGLADITPQYDSSITTDLGKTVSFIGWKGNLWEYLKMLCAGVVSTSGAHIETYALNGVLRFRKALDTANLIDISDEVSSEDISFDSTNLAQKIEMYNYNTQYKTNGIIYEDKELESGPTGLKTYPATSGVISVNAGETSVTRVKTKASLLSVQQPTAVTTMGTPPYSGSTSKYVVVGPDDIVIQPSAWTAAGGSVSVAIVGDAKDELEITVNTPAAPSSTTPGGDGGQSGTGLGGITKLASPTSLAATHVTAQDYDIDFVPANAAQYYKVSYKPQGAGIETIITTVGTPRVGLSAAYRYWDVKMMSVTDAGYSATESNVQVTSDWSEICVIDTTLFDQTSTTPGGNTEIKGTGEVVVNDVNHPDVPGAPESGTSDPNSAPTTLSFSSYKIGIETAGSSSDYPAFYIVGTGVFYDKQITQIPTGLTSADTTTDVGATIDNPFITTTTDFNAKKALALKKFDTPKVTLSQSVAAPRTFGTLPGSTQIVDGATFRIESVSYSPSDVNITSSKV